jgi:filamentous hemagglutinin family protein
MIDTKFWLSFLTLVGLFSMTQVAQAQTYQPSNRVPVSDNTLGTQVSGAGGNFDIKGGVSKGQTLFHSFTDFSVPTSGQANFLNPVGNRDIITRVTGNLFSDINGLVNTNGANFFLINPSGIVFGPNAQLNVGKAFVGSTANSIDLVGGGQTITFGTNPSGDAPLLSVAPNVLFDVARLNLGGGAGSISNFGSLFIPNLNQYIGLIGGNVSMNGGQINAPGGQVDLGGLSASGSVVLGKDGNNLSAQFPTNIARGDVALTNKATVNVVGQGGGDININARNVEILAGSIVSGGIVSGFGTPETVAGDIKINATENVSADGVGSRVRNFVRENGLGKGGNVEINSRNLTVTNSAQLSASTFGQGDAGNVKITTTGDISFDGLKDSSISGIFSTVEQGALGKGGNIEINTRNLSVTNAARLAADTNGKGDAGNIKIIATGDVSFDGNKDGLSSAVGSIVRENGLGKGGNIEINARNLSVTNAARLVASTDGKGDAGNIKIIATGDVSFDGKKDDLTSAALSQVGASGVEKGGKIDIDSRNLSVTNGAGLSTTTRGKGDAGSIKIKAKDNIFLAGKNSGVFSTIAPNSVGKGGEIEINSSNLNITNQAQVNTSSIGQGSAGNIVVNANKIVLNTSGRTTTSSLTSIAGDLNITTKEYLLLQNNSLIDTNSLSTALDGNGGNITISSPLIIATPGNNDITANAVQGNGGNLKINSQGLFGIQFRAKGQDSPTTNDITASSRLGRDGTVNIDTPGTDPGKDNTELPKVPTDASNQISQVCGANSRQNKLTVTGRGGLPPNANDPLTSDVVWQDARAASPQPVATNPKTNPVKLAAPAVGLVFDGKGKVTLVAAGTQGQPAGTSVVCPPTK